MKLQSLKEQQEQLKPPEALYLQQANGSKTLTINR